MCRSCIVTRDAIEAVTDRSAIITAGFEELTPYQRCILAPERRASSGAAMEQNVSLSLSETSEKWSEYASSQLKRARRAIQSIRDQAELPPETADALQELVDVVRYPTESIALPNRK
jgi:hypothetical protein